MTSRFLLFLPLASRLCLTRRTVVSGGATTEQKIIIQRPAKNLIEISQ